MLATMAERWKLEHIEVFYFSYFSLFIGELTLFSIFYILFFFEPTSK